jgi:hypothetical protein
MTMAPPQSPPAGPQLAPSADSKPPQNYLPVLIAQNGVPPSALSASVSAIVGALSAPGIAQSESPSAAAAAPPPPPAKREEEVVSAVHALLSLHADAAPAPAAPAAAGATAEVEDHRRRVSYVDLIRLSPGVVQ